MDFTSFHHATVANFQPCAVPRREPDFVSASGSAYWDDGDAVVRASDHWGRVRSCWWLYADCRRQDADLVGRCHYADFAVRAWLTIDRRPVVGRRALPRRIRLRRRSIPVRRRETARVQPITMASRRQPEGSRTSVASNDRP